MKTVSVRAVSVWLTCAALGVAGCSSDSTSGVITPDAGEVVDVPADITTSPDVPVTLDIPSVPDVPAAVDAPDVVDVAVAMDVPLDQGGGCHATADCTDPAHAACDAVTGRCVECVPTADTCDVARHCDPGTLTCVDGCRSDEACRAATADGGGTALRCDPARHECVECLTDPDCASGRVCAAGVCVAGCSATSPCPAGGTCCSGACVDLMASAVSCGTCDNRCGLANAVAYCRVGSCAVSSCSGGYADCDAAPGNGCEVNAQTDLNNCGACGTVCPMGAHVSARSCVVGHCGITCEVGFGDCDGDPANGCEVDLVTTATQCGTCGNVCPARPHAAPACVSRACALVCAGGFGDCDGDAADGCEADLTASAANCGACGRACAVPHATAGCGGSMCAITTCDAGYGNCNGAYSDGCEAPLNTTVNCGACGRAGTEVCDGADNDCDGAVDEGCPTGINNLRDLFSSLQFGGTGGGSFNDVCPGGLGVGFAGRSGDRLDQIGMRCMPLALSEDRSVTPFRYYVRASGSLSILGQRGGSGGSPYTAQCDGGSFITGLYGRSGSRVDQMSFGCGYWEVVGSPTGGWRLQTVTTSPRGPFGGGGGTVFSYDCPSNTGMTTLYGRSGSELDAIGARCGQPDIVVR